MVRLDNKADVVRCRNDVWCMVEPAVAISGNIPCNTLKTLNSLIKEARPFFPKRH